MIESEIRQHIIRAIENIAPEIDGDTLDVNVDFREECDLDSMDFLNLVVAMNKACGVVIPEKDYAKVMSLKAMANYLLERIE
jgi:acyl carrier protein